MELSITEDRSLDVRSELMSSRAYCSNSVYTSADDVLFILDEGFEPEDEVEFWRFPSNIDDSRGRLKRRAPSITNTSPVQTSISKGFENGSVSEPASPPEYVLIQ